MAPDDPEDDNPLQRWLDAEERWGDPEGGFGNAPPDESETERAPAQTHASADGENATIEIDSRTSRYFWSAVVLANIALAAVSLGLMLIGFWGNWVLGGGLVLIGLLAGARTYWLYRAFRRDEQSGD